MKYLTVQEVAFADPGAFGTRLDPLMEELLRLEAADPAIEDPDLAVDPVTSSVDVQMTVDAEDPAAALVKALATLRAAIDATGGATPGWETTSAVMHAAPVDTSERLLSAT